MGAGQAAAQRVLHGDGRLENIAIGPSGEAVVLDLGFSAVRPRVHDLAYALAWALLGPDDSRPAWSNDVAEARGCVAAYEEGAGAPLDEIERRALDGYLAGTCLHLTAIAAQVADPESLVLEPGQRRLVDIARDVLDSPGRFV